MLYTMAFDVWVGAAHGITLVLFLAWHLRRDRLSSLLRVYRCVIVAMCVVIVGYLPYLWMAIRWQYTRNASDNAPQIWTLGNYTYIANEHFAFAPWSMWILGALVVIGILGELRARRPLLLVWLLVAAGQVAFVIYFMTGRAQGPSGRYIAPALPAVCFLAATGWHHLAARLPRALWAAVPLALAYLSWPEFVAYTAYAKTPAPVGPLERLRIVLERRPGKKVIFFDVGYAGQDLEYVLRDNPEITFATMRGTGWASGGSDHLDAEYIRATILRTHAETRCYHYQASDPRGVYGSSQQNPSEEAPKAPDAIVSLDEGDAEAAAAKIIAVLVKRGILSSQYAL